MKILTLFCATFASTTNGQILPPMNIDADHITVAGFSSGSWMSMNAHVVYSDIFKGAGLLSGGAYGAGPYYYEVQEWGPNSEQKQRDFVKKLGNFAENNSKMHKIASISNIRDSPVYIEVGNEDEIVYPFQVNIQKDFYKHFGANIKYNLRTQKELSGHVWAPGFAYRELNHLLTNIPGTGFSPRNPLKREDFNWRQKGTIRQWDQLPFVNLALAEIYHTKEDIGHLYEHWHHLQYVGSLYQPNACKAKKCLLHLVLHGCTESAETTIERYAPVAAANDIVLLAPQTKKCWDDGRPLAYTEVDTGVDTKFTRQSIQLTFFKKIIDQVKQPFANPSQALLTDLITEMTELDQMMELFLI